MNNEIDFPPIQEVTLDSVSAELAHWRDTRHEHRETSIPDDIWRKIFSLESQHSATKLRSLFGVSNSQYKTRREKLSATTEMPPTATPTCAASEVDNDYVFCQPGLNIQGQPVKPEPYKVQTRTVTVEFRRADGRIMTIHTTTESFKELLEAFFAGDVTS